MTDADKKTVTVLLASGATLVFDADGWAIATSSSQGISRSDAGLVVTRDGDPVALFAAGTYTGAYLTGGLA